VDKSSMDKPITGLPESRKRPRAFGTPSIAEFVAAVSRHRDPSGNSKGRSSRAKK
jgi:hypothetical protein